MANSKKVDVLIPNLDVVKKKARKQSFKRKILSGYTFCKDSICWQPLFVTLGILCGLIDLAVSVNFGIFCRKSFLEGARGNLSEKAGENIFVGLALFCASIAILVLSSLMSALVVPLSAYAILTTYHIVKQKFNKCAVAEGPDNNIDSINTNDISV